MNKKDLRQTNLADVKKQIKEVNTELKDGVFIYTGPMSVSEFANKINKNPNEIVRQFFMQGKMLNLNSTLDDEQIAELCLESGYDFQREKQVTASNLLEEFEIKDDPKDLQPRPPVVTIMGHVDHGKTTLIDFIRKSSIVKGEAGGITQHTGAYQVTTKEGRKITFLDTPGHEAFTAMRARGANITDIVIIVVAADDGVMPQTKEAISHAKVANVPIIVFVNKMDKGKFDLEKLKSQLSELNLTPEEWGGDTVLIPGSGLTGMGVDNLLESIILQADLLELKANPKRHAIGTVIESKIDKGQGVVTTIIVTTGTLHLRDFIVAGHDYGRIKTIYSTSNDGEIKNVTPGMPAIITGLNSSPEAGVKFMGFEDEKFAKSFAGSKQFEDKQRKLRLLSSTTKNDDRKVKNLIIKSDVSGTAEAIKHSLEKIQHEEVGLKIVHASAGNITKADIILAKASNAIIYAFNLKVPSEIKEQAKNENVQLFTSSIIYQIIEDVERMMKGMEAPKYKEKQIAEAIILKIIFASKFGNIAGSKVLSGEVKSNSKVELYRMGKLIHTGKIDSLKREMNDAKKVENGKEFGCHIKDFNEIQEGDILKFYEDVRID